MKLKISVFILIVFMLSLIISCGPSKADLQKQAVNRVTSSLIQDGDSETWIVTSTSSGISLKCKNFKLVQFDSSPSWVYREGNTLYENLTPEENNTIGGALQYLLGKRVTRIKVNNLIQYSQVDSFVEESDLNDSDYIKN